MARGGSSYARRQAREGRAGGTSAAAFGATLASAAPRICRGVMIDGPAKLHCRCDTCGAVSYEANEGDRCGREVRP